MAFYRQAAPRPPDKARFFELLCRDFGTQRARPPIVLFGLYPVAKAAAARPARLGALMMSSLARRSGAGCGDPGASSRAWRRAAPRPSCARRSACARRRCRCTPTCSHSSATSLPVRLAALPLHADAACSQAHDTSHARGVPQAFQRAQLFTQAWSCDRAPPLTRLLSYRRHMRSQPRPASPGPCLMPAALCARCHADMHLAAAASLPGAAARCGYAAQARPASCTTEDVHRTAATLGLSQG